MNKQMVSCRIRQDNYNRLVKLTDLVGGTPTSITVDILDELIPDLKTVELNGPVTNRELLKIRQAGALIVYNGLSTFALCLNRHQVNVAEKLNEEYAHG